MNDRPLKSVGWLSEHINDPQVRIIDASWHMPASGRDANAEFLAGHIPGAVFLDIDTCAEPDHLPHTFPSATRFSRMASELGIADDHDIVVYDSVGLFSAARVWWMCRYFGAQRVSVLDGGLPAWLDAGLAMESGAPSWQATSFAVYRNALKIVDADDVLAASRNASSLILDARSHARFTGAELEARAGLRSGHIPGSQCMPFTELVHQGRLKSNDELRRLLAERGVTGSRPIMTTCGSGVTAAIIILALECIGVTDVALYDGSWSEWGGLPDSPVATGNAAP